MIGISPMWGVVLNLLVAVGGLSEVTQLTNVLSGAGKAGAMVALGIGLVNSALHAMSSTQPGPLAPPDPQVGQRMPPPNRPL
jgi:hypothetical protein